MIPIVGAIKAWTVIWNLLLISFTGGVVASCLDCLVAL